MGRGVNDFHASWIKTKQGEAWLMQDYDSGAVFFRLRDVIEE